MVLPRYITTTSSATLATTPRSWVMSSTDMPVSSLKLLDQIEDLGLRGHVERRRRLVRDQQGRARDESHGDHGALAQAAGELERIGLEGSLGIGEADPREHFHGALVRLGLIHVGVDHQRFGNLVADGVERRQRGHRLLEDHGDAPAAKSVHDVALRRQGRDVDGLFRSTDR